MRYASICDGIGAVHVAWKPLGWECAWTAEIEPFPAAVVEHHHGLPNLGDMTRITDEQIEQHGAIDLIAGGTPCQSFSVAGLRKGLDDPRGNLALVFLGLAERTRALWLVWENVPGVLSSGGGRDFGSFLGALGELGYGFAYRVLDAQYFGLAQRRKRVFVVGYLGDWRRAAAVLFEREGMRGDSPPSREAGEGTPGAVANCLRGRSNDSHRADTSNYVAGTLMATYGTGSEQHPERVGRDNQLICSTGHTGHCLNAGGMGRQDYETETLIAHALCAEHDASEDGTGRGTPIVPVKTGIGVRRLTPLECERLQGFPDNYTLINFKGKPAADSPRYKALGNSMAVPVMAWIGKRIQMVERASFNQ